MAEIQSIGAADYAMPVQQQNQYETEIPSEETTPMVYDPETEEKKSAASKMLGLTLLGVALVGGGLLAGHAWGKAGKTIAKETQEELVNTLKENNETLKAALNEAKDLIAETKESAIALAEEAKNVTDNTFGGFKYGKDFAGKVKSKVNTIKTKSEEMIIKSEEAIKKAEESVQEKAEEVVEAAEEAVA